MLIPKHIDASEFFVRFIFADHFKKEIALSKIKDQEIFTYSFDLGVSLQRAKFTTEDFCRSQAEHVAKIAKKQLAGFVLFKKSDFLNACDEFRKENADKRDFDAILEFTPLSMEDGELLYLRDRDVINTSDQGNPSHCDIIYLNPGVNINMEKPQISLRIFSRKLFSKSIPIIEVDEVNTLLSAYF